MIVKKPIITEKAALLAKQNQYVFEVSKEATKDQIKKEIEERFKVEVVSVKILKIPPKQRRWGRILGKRKGIKKAIVKIKPGQKIEIFPEYEEKK